MVNRSGEWLDSLAYALVAEEGHQIGRDNAYLLCPIFLLFTTPTGQEMPVPPSPQYPFGTSCKYCWW